MKRSMLKLGLTVLAASALLALVASGSMAQRLSVSEREFDIRWRLLTFTPTSGGPVACPVTLLGTFHSRTIRKVANTLIGVIDHASIGDNGGREDPTCAGGGATALLETLPWHVTYESFNGTLPNITAVNLRLIRASFQISNEVGTCLAITDTTDYARGIANVTSPGGQIRTLTADPLRSIDANGFICDFGGVSGRFSGTGDVENRHGGLLFIRLI